MKETGDFQITLMKLKKYIMKLKMNIMRNVPTEMICPHYAKLRLVLIRSHQRMAMMMRLIHWHSSDAQFQFLACRVYGPYFDTIHSIFRFSMYVFCFGGVECNILNF